MARRFGEIEGYPPGSMFRDRHELATARVHCPLQAGISGDKEFGAESIVLSGEYEDDEDFGNVIFYTGHGGNNDGHQVAAQSLLRGNLALARSRVVGRPVRVIRGSKHNFRNVPELEVIAGYRYDGLFRVDDYWLGIGKSNLPIWRFRLVEIPLDLSNEARELAIAEDIPAYEPAAGEDFPSRSESMIHRVLRITEVANSIKALYSSHCQICRTTIETIAGNYSEAAHIRPLGEPHNGPDQTSNVLCLCPNHHAMFDMGGMVIRDDLIVMNPKTGEMIGSLHLHPLHQLDMEVIRYHRSMYMNDVVVPFETGVHSFRSKLQRRSNPRQKRLFGS